MKFIGLRDTILTNINLYKRSTFQTIVKFYLMEKGGAAANTREVRNVDLYCPM